MFEKLVGLFRKKEPPRIMISDSSGAVRAS